MLLAPTADEAKCSLGGRIPQMQKNPKSELTTQAKEHLPGLTDKMY